ncbi:MAG: CRISPR-associated endonuclease Cas1 [Leptospira sp.]|nr:CRISPR-associated endonuclease Cas1 [Leptospira sp.]
MKHVTIEEYGAFLGISGERLQISLKGILLKEIPLNRIKTISFSKNGASCSTNLLLQCSVRGIRVFLRDFKNEIVGSFQGLHEHAVCQVRKKQFSAFDSNEFSISISKKWIYGKIRNQRSVLLYFDKYHKKKNLDSNNHLTEAADYLKSISEKINAITSNSENWREVIMGFEGSAARKYWEALRMSNLLPASFKGRIGRGAKDLVNTMLNYGYAILETPIWNCISNAGLEAYLGFLHVQRPGKPSLVLDLMEEYRPWVVDRNVIKLCGEDDTTFGDIQRKRLIAGIHETLSNKYFYKKKKVKLESIIQRQIYRFVASFSQTQEYKPYVFKW